MPRTTKKNAEETVAVVVEETAAAAPAEKEAPKKAAAKKAPAKKTAAKKPAAKTAKAAENVFIQFGGAEITSADLIKRAKDASGVKSPKKVDVYVKPEDNKVYYVVDNNAGDFTLFE